MAFGESIHDVVRDAPLGQLVRFFTSNRLFKYPEEQPDFKLPGPWIRMMSDAEIDRIPRPKAATSSTISNLNREQEVVEAEHDVSNAAELDLESKEFAEDKSTRLTPKITKDGTILVDWYYEEDTANPHNWSNLRRALLALLICFYTFVVYLSSAIYTSSTQGVMEKFGVSNLKATLGLAMYVLGYGVGPLLFSPLSEIPRIGRSPIYIITMGLFVVLSIPTALVNNFAGLIVLRFLQGFFGSPCLASGGASMSDMYSLINLPFAMIAWVAAMSCGPSLGPLISGFAVPAENWRWSLYESIWVSAPVLIALFMFMPETSGPNILLRRAQRLRKLTGSQKLMSQSEIDQGHMTVSGIAIDALIKPLEITLKDPAVMFVQVYSAIVYGIYYSYFEVFPLVYPVFYHMNLGQVGLVFMCIIIGCIVAIIAYGLYLYLVVTPRVKKVGMGPQENVLIPGLPISFGPTIGLFMFAWTARVSIHWIVPTIGISIYAGSTFIVLQCMFLYIPLSYPQYAASLFAANDFFRSALASGSILFAHPLYQNLGFSKGTSLLGGLSVIGIIGMWLLFFYGAKLRALSKFATYSED
ncbi:major facilitator superfamily domain-containing protein [Talaromyces proteolyticus]|uniref:Major facilitator superfamily domain-containing protein n=1 Tax=Talaromyces proteolyticus TaxID=1131652 RepID=A0AAD4KKJ9_9EURO|nr:major facilitator superfamily domain-containing protein [Talaromyces proteolyticus]KAH8692333.1 major facilitator superfamily domain-containing protein [Talaromyces proteolyticus]